MPALMTLVGLQAFRRTRGFVAHFTTYELLTSKGHARIVPVPWSPRV